MFFIYSNDQIVRQMRFCYQLIAISNIIGSLLMLEIYLSILYARITWSRNVLNQNASFIILFRKTFSQYPTRGRWCEFASENPDVSFVCRYCGFYSTGEKLSARQVVDLQTRYFSKMTPSVKNTELKNFNLLVTPINQLRVFVIDRIMLKALLMWDLNF